MAYYWKYGPKRDEYNFFSTAFSIIDEFSPSSPKCRAVFQELASKASYGSIKNWNEIPLPQITQTDFGGYRQAVETIFRRLNTLYKKNQETQSRIKQLLRQSVAILKRRICDIERCGLQGEPNVAANHLHVIELWSRCMKQSLDKIDFLEKDQSIQSSLPFSWKTTSYVTAKKSAPDNFPDYIILLLVFAMVCVSFFEYLNNDKHQ